MALLWASEDEGGSRFASEMAVYVGQQERQLGFNRSRQNQLFVIRWALVAAERVLGVEGPTLSL